MQPAARRVPQLPAGWKTVTYHGIGIDVPRTWKVKQWDANCGVSAPTVFIGPVGSMPSGCQPLAYDASEVVMGGLQFTNTGHMVRETLNGLRASVESREFFFHGPRTGHYSGTITYTAVTVPSADMSISVLVGDSVGVPGGAPGRAEQIVQTIHATTHTTASACTASPGSPSITLSDQSPAPAITVSMGAKVVVNIPRAKADGDATDIAIGDSDVLEEVCTVLLPDHGRRSIVLALGQGQSGMEATTSGLTSGVFIPAWSGRVQVTS